MEPETDATHASIYRFINMKSALSIIESRSWLVVIQTEKAIGANFDLIAKLRNEESSTRRALIIKDHEENQA